MSPPTVFSLGKDFPAAISSIKDDSLPRLKCASVETHQIAHNDPHTLSASAFIKKYSVLTNRLDILMKFATSVPLMVGYFPRLMTSPCDDGARATEEPKAS